MKIFAREFPHVNSRENVSRVTKASMTDGKRENIYIRGATITWETFFFLVASKMKEEKKKNAARADLHKRSRALFREKQRKLSRNDDSNTFLMTRQF